MKRIGKRTKKGFTLVEMLLAIAITLVISILFVNLIIAVKDSFYRVYNDDDSTDIAALYAQALENQMIYDSQNGNANTYRISPTDYILVTYDGSTETDTFGFRALTDFNVNKDGVYKWRVYLQVRTESDGVTLAKTDAAGNKVAPGTVQYTLYVVDNYYDPGKLVQTYTGSFWLPDHLGFATGDTEYTVTVGSESYEAKFKSGDNKTEYGFTPNTLIISEKTTADDVEDDE
ncbi:MAG: type II secretion system GspH family protein [Saccharofermentans sp.]|nr:type II secretion system GspH family protein [Saccharofermentans sp.]